MREDPLPNRQPRRTCPARHSDTHRREGYSTAKRNSLVFELCVLAPHIQAREASSMGEVNRDGQTGGLKQSNLPTGVWRDRTAAGGSLRVR